MSPALKEKTDGAQPETTSSRSVEQRQRLIVKALKANQQRKRIQRRFEFNWISWFLDEFPCDETSRPPLGKRRNTRQEMNYHRFRQMTSWSFWSRMKSSSGIKLAAAGGLVAAFFQAAPILKGTEATVGPLGWLLVAGFFYVLAVMLFEARCPDLLKRTLAGNDGYLGIEGRRWLLALVEDELRRWWSVEPYHPTKSNVETDEDQIALAMIRDGHKPGYGGFDSYASARIEQALEEYAQLTSTVIWRNEGGADSVRKMEATRGSYGQGLVLRSFFLDELREIDVEQLKAGNTGDLVLRWVESSLDVTSRIPSQRDVNISAHTEGLIYLFRCDATSLVFTRILAQWQNTMHPWSRLLLVSLFLASGGCFLWFVVLLLKILKPFLV